MTRCSHLSHGSESSREVRAGRLGPRRASLAGLLVLGLCLSAGPGCRKVDHDADEGAGREASRGVVEVQAARVESRPMVDTLQVRGTLVAADGAGATLAPVTSGRLRSVEVHAGEHVRQGQVLARVDNATDERLAASAAAALQAAQADAEGAVLQALAGAQAADLVVVRNRHGARTQELRIAELAVERDRAALARAETELQRVSYLYEQGTVARRQLDDARLAEKLARTSLDTSSQQQLLLREGVRREEARQGEVAQRAARQALGAARRGSSARLAQARAALQAAEATVRQGEVRAPFDGVVVKRMLGPGDIAGPGSPVLQLADPGSLVLVAGLASSQLAGVRQGLEARVHDTHGKLAAHGRVLGVGQADPQTGLIELRVLVANPQHRLRLGELVSADLVLARHAHAVAVPDAALLQRDGRVMVLTIDPGGKVHERVVATGGEQEGWTRITRGLEVGETVVTEGAHELEDGAAVRAARPAADAEGPAARGEAGARATPDAPPRAAGSARAGGGEARPGDGGASKP